MRSCRGRYREHGTQGAEDGHQPAKEWCLRVARGDQDGVSLATGGMIIR